jgi:hypothetical protein
MLDALPRHFSYLDRKEVTDTIYLDHLSNTMMIPAAFLVLALGNFPLPSAAHTATHQVAQLATHRSL